MALELHHEFRLTQFFLKKLERNHVELRE